MEASYDSALQLMAHRGCAIYLSKGAGLQCFFRRTASRPGCLSACIHFFILALTGSKSGAEGLEGQGSAPGELRMLLRGAISRWRPVVFCKESWAAFAESCIFFLLLLLFTNRAFHLGMKRLIAIGFSQPCTIREGVERMRGCNKKKRKISFCLALTIAKDFYCCSSTRWFLPSRPSELGCGVALPY